MGACCGGRQHPDMRMVRDEDSAASDLSDHYVYSDTQSTPTALLDSGKTKQKVNKNAEAETTRDDAIIYE